MSDAAAIKARVLADPNTAKIAAEFGVSVDEYADQVVHYALNPKADPEMVVAEDEDLRAAGFEVPDEQAMAQYLIDTVSTVDAAEGDGFRAAQKKAVDLGEQQAVPDGSGASEALTESLKKQLRGTGKKG